MLKGTFRKCNKELKRAQVEEFVFGCLSCCVSPAMNLLRELVFHAGGSANFRG